jgi:uncharacterized GH25 family protein
MNTLFLERIRRQCTEKLALLLALWLLSAAVCAPALAHDFWIEPESFRPQQGARVALRLYVGQDFKGDTNPYIPELIERYVAVSDRGERRIAGVAGDDPAGAFIPDAPGVTVIGYHSAKYPLRFDSLAAFEQYLTQEGLEQHLTLARKRHAVKDLVFENYTRSAKSLVLTAPADGRLSDRTLGLPLELIAEAFPETRAGGALRVRLLFRGKPLEGALLVASNKQGPQHKLRARSDKDGRVEFTLPRPGVWLLTSVHMLPAPLLSRADWESTWASLTFEL